MPRTIRRSTLAASLTSVASAASRLLVALALLVGVAVAPASAAPAGAEPSGGCRAVGGGPVDRAGSHRATVVVDPGSGPVWSACITFDGTVSGIQALELAAATIPGLAPVYEPYGGQGRAICRLLGVGNDPPDCLSKSVEYWSYFRNGAYARGGGSASVVSDGDVEGWSFSRGQAPRGATAGTEAVPLSEVPVTTAPPPPTTAPPADPPTTAVPGGQGDPSGSGGSTDPGGSTAPGAGTPSTTTGSGGSEGSEGSGDGAAPGASGSAGGSDTSSTTLEPEGSGRAESVDGAAGTMTLRQSDDGDGSALGSVVGFGGALGVAGLAAVLVRRRRHSAAAN